MCTNNQFSAVTTLTFQLTVNSSLSSSNPDLLEDLESSIMDDVVDCISDITTHPSDSLTLLEVGTEVSVPAYTPMQPYAAPVSSGYTSMTSVVASRNPSPPTQAPAPSPTSGYTRLVR